MPATDEQKAVLSVLRILLNKGEYWMRSERKAKADAAARVAESQFTAMENMNLKFI